MAWHRQPCPLVVQSLLRRAERRRPEAATDNHRSVLAVILLHFTGNLCQDIFTVPGPQFRIFQLLAIALAGVIAAAWLRASPKQTIALVAG